MKCKRVCTSLLTIGLLLLMAFAGWTALKSMRIAQVKSNPTVARNAGKPMPVSTVKVEQGTLDSLVGAECVAKESRRVALATEFDFQVVSVDITLGMQVKKDQSLLKFDDTPAKAILANAVQGQAAARSLVNDLEPFLADVRKLEKKKLISVVDMLQVVKDLGQARIDLIRISKDVINAKQLISKAEVRAPLDGVVTTLNVEAGSTPQPFTDLLVISQVDPIHLECAFAETDIETVTQHDSIEASFDAYPGRMFHAEFFQLLPVAKEQSGTLTVLIQVANPQQILLPGMHALARIAKRLQGLRIPAIALIKPEQGRANVFVIDEDDRAQLREVQVGRYAQGYVQILKGLEAGERVVVAGQLYLLDGDKIREDGGNGDRQGELYPIRVR
jgi:membrane fusion protein (multidrug efflux system)